MNTLMEMGNTVPVTPGRYVRQEQSNILAVQVPEGLEAMKRIAAWVRSLAPAVGFFTADMTLTAKGAHVMQIRHKGPKGERDLFIVGKGHYLVFDGMLWKVPKPLFKRWHVQQEEGEDEGNR